MRALIDVPNDLIDDLDALSKSKKVSRAEIMRRALREYANNNAPKSEGFGLWGGSQIDGLELQQRLRDEW